MKLRSWVACTCAGLGSMVLMTAAAVSFVDPLDEPAHLSELAGTTRLLAIAQAGKRLVVGGPRGHVLFSDDGGSSWTQAEVPVSIALTALRFATPEEGWAVGHSGVVLHTADGGATWQRQVDGRQTAAEVLAFYNQLVAGGDESAARMRDELAINWEHGAEQPWLGVWFENPKHGFVVGPFNLIMETHDGGTSWTPWMHRIDNPSALHLNAIEQIGGALYLPSEQGLVFRMKPGEERFRALQTPYTGSFFGVCGDDQMVLAYGLRGTVYASLDQGDSWTRVDTALATAMTSCTQLAQDAYVLGASSGQLVRITRSPGLVNSVTMQPAPWPLTGLTTSDGRLVGVGNGGVWLQSQ